MPATLDVGWTPYRGVGSKRGPLGACAEAVAATAISQHPKTRTVTRPLQNRGIM